jgi:hypothetical protein
VRHGQTAAAAHSAARAFGADVSASKVSFQKRRVSPTAA